MNYNILYRCSDETKDEEVKYAKNIFNTDFYLYRSWIPSNSITIGRYSVLPFYKELEQELLSKNSYLINSYNQHKFISDMEWYHILKDVTPKSYFNHGYMNVPSSEHGWIVKGLTNSRKFLWNTHMYAYDRYKLKNVINNLMDDTLIGEQGLVIREYIPLKILEHGVNGLNFTHEYRYFFLYGKLIERGFYWGCAENPIDNIPEICDDLAYEVANRLKKYVNFFVVDVAETKRNGAIVIEINDGQMSGLSTIDPFNFYNKIRELTLGD